MTAIHERVPQRAARQLQRMAVPFLLGLLSTLAIEANAAVTAEPNLKLEKSVLLVRHGARSPNQTPEQLAPSSRRPWPQWPMGSGELTPRGISLMTSLGTYYRQLYAAQQLLPEKGCLEAGAVSVWADNVVRRVPLSGLALLEGLSPGCDPKVGFAPQDKGADPLFNPVETGLCTISPVKARAAIKKAAGGDIADAVRSERTALKAMQAILQVRASGSCTNGEVSCGIEDFGNVLTEGSGPVSLEGGLKAATAVGENLLLQYVQGFPEQDVAWGEAATPELLTPMLKPRNLYLRLTRQPPYIAARNATPLAKAMLAALDDRVQSSTLVGQLPSASLLAIFVGRDTHLASLSGMLGLQWSLPDQPDQFPLGGTLAFERLVNPEDGSRYVRTVLYYQSLIQMRSLAVLDRDHPPGRVALMIPGCEQEAVQGACPLAVVRKHFEAAFSDDCKNL